MSRSMRATVRLASRMARDGLPDLRGLDSFERDPKVRRDETSNLHTDGIVSDQELGSKVGRFANVAGGTRTEWLVSPSLV